MASFYGKRKRGATGSRKISAKRGRVFAKYGAARRRSYASKYLRRPTRLRGSRMQYALNRAVGKVINGITENKLVPVNPINESSGIPIQLGAIAYYKGFVLGGIPGGWDTSLENLGGTTIPQGTSDGQRIGDSVYLRKTHLMIEIEAQTAYQQCIPKEFRVVIVKSRQANVPAGLTVYPQNSLFLNNSGEAFGYATSGVNGSDLMLQPINKRNWSVFMDRKFMLSNPVANQIGDAVDSPFVNWTGKYPNQRRISVNLPFYAKTHYSSGGVPADLDTHYVVYVFAKGVGKDYSADDWEVNIRGTTSYKDL